jgi:transcriptional regulator with XRE-family HTH domain
LVVASRNFGVAIVADPTPDIGVVEPEDRRAWLILELNRTGMSQAEVADAMGLGRDKLNKMVKGRRKISHEEEVRLREVFKGGAPIPFPVPRPPASPKVLSLPSGEVVLTLPAHMSESELALVQTWIAAHLAACQPAASSPA